MLSSQDILDKNFHIGLIFLCTWPVRSDPAQVPLAQIDACGPYPRNYASCSGLEDK